MSSGSSNINGSNVFLSNDILHVTNLVVCELAIQGDIHPLRHMASLLGKYDVILDIQIGSATYSTNYIKREEVHLLTTELLSQEILDAICDLSDYPNIDHKKSPQCMIQVMNKKSYSVDEIKIWFVFDEGPDIKCPLVGLWKGNYADMEQSKLNNNASNGTFIHESLWNCKSRSAREFMTTLFDREIATASLGLVRKHPRRVTRSEPLGYIDDVNLIWNFGSGWTVDC